MVLKGIFLQREIQWFRKRRNNREHHQLVQELRRDDGWLKAFSRMIQEQFYNLLSIIWPN